MDQTRVIRGRIHQGVFLSDEPIPDLETRADLIVYTPAQASEDEVVTGSIFGLFGKAERLRSGKEIDAQVRDERAWGDE